MMKSKSGNWYHDSWMFGELSDLDGKQRTYPIKTTKVRHLYPLQRGENSTKFNVACAGQINMATDLYKCEEML